MTAATRGALPLAAFVVLATFSAPAAAAAGRFGDVVVDVAIPIDSSCPTDEEFLSAIGVAIADSEATTAAASFEVIIETSTHRGAVGTLVSHGDTRQVTGATCREVAEALALVLLLSIDPRASSVELPMVSGRRRLPHPAPEPSSRTESVPARPPPSSPVARASHPLRLDAFASPSVVVGLLPHAGVEAALGVAARLGTAPLEARLSGGAFAPVDLRRDDGTLEFHAFRVAATLCAWLGAEIAAGACGGIGVDGVFTHASGFKRTADTSAAIPSISVGPMGRYQLSHRWTLGIETDAAVVLAPTRWNVLPVGEVHHTATIEGSASVFVQVRFW